MSLVNQATEYIVDCLTTTNLRLSVLISLRALASLNTVLRWSNRMIRHVQTALTEHPADQ